MMGMNLPLPLPKYLAVAGAVALMVVGASTCALSSSGPSAFADDAPIGPGGLSVPITVGGGDEGILFSNYPTYIPPILAVRENVLWWGTPCSEVEWFAKGVEGSGFPIYDIFVSGYGTGECVILTGPSMKPDGNRS